MRALRPSSSRPVEKFDADVKVKRGNEIVGGTSIMGLMMLAAGPGTSITVEATGNAGGRSGRGAGSARERAVHRRRIRRSRERRRRDDTLDQATCLVAARAASLPESSQPAADRRRNGAYSRFLSAASRMRSRNDGWMVTKAAVPSDNSNLRPRSLAMVTGRPSRLRAALAPSATMTAGLTISAFELEPDLAALDFVGVGTLVQAALAAHLMLEMLHRVGDENLRAGDPRFRQGPVEDLPGGPDERLAGKVFLVAGLLANQHQVRMRGALRRGPPGSHPHTADSACRRSRPWPAPPAT